MSISPQGQTVPQDEQVRLEVARIQKKIGSEGPALENIADRLHGILETTEQSCESILQSIEGVFEATNKIRSALPDSEAVKDACDVLEQHATSVLESCAFQDLTSQRVSMIVRDLLHVEGCVDAVTDAVGRDEVESLAARLTQQDSTQDDDTDGPYLHGPQNEKEAFSQRDVDEMFG